MTTPTPPRPPQDATQASTQPMQAVPAPAGTAPAAVAQPPGPFGPHPARAPATREGTRRNTELGLLLAVIGLLFAMSAATEAALLAKVTAAGQVLPALLALLFLAAHVVVRFLAPYADPVLLPCVALINGLGVVFLRRIDIGVIPRAERLDVGIGGLGVRQWLWTFVAVLLFCVLLAVIRDHRAPSRYAYTLAAIGLVLLVIPAVLPRTFSDPGGGAKLWILIGPPGRPWLSIQPGEFAKLALICFFAYYLVRKREVLSLASKRILGIDFPRGRDLGPVLVVWAVSLLVLVFESDLGTSLMFFGTFVAMLYVATERTSWLIIGLGLFVGGTYAAYLLVSRLQVRVAVWLDPFQDPSDTGFQPIQALYALGTGGLFGAGPGAGSPQKIPVVESDYIVAGLGEEIGLFGLTAILAVYLVVVERGLRTALAVRDSFGKLLAAGLSFTLGLQVFVIVGGVSKLIPLTGLTTPFLSYGGSSLVANWLLLAMLLRISDAARRPVVAGMPEAGRR